MRTKKMYTGGSKSTGQHTQPLSRKYTVVHVATAHNSPQGYSFTPRHKIRLERSTERFLSIGYMGETHTMKIRVHQDGTIETTYTEEEYASLLRLRTQLKEDVWFICKAVSDPAELNELVNLISDWWDRHCKQE